jgi:hypothetical protein
MLRIGNEAVISPLEHFNANIADNYFCAFIRKEPSLRCALPTLDPFLTCQIHTAKTLS